MKKYLIIIAVVLLAAQIAFATTPIYTPGASGRSGTGHFYASFIKPLKIQASGGGTLGEFVTSTKPYTSADYAFNGSNVLTFAIQGEATQKFFYKIVSTTSDAAGNSITIAWTDLWNGSNYSNNLVVNGVDPTAVSGSTTSPNGTADGNGNIIGFNTIDNSGNFVIYGTVTTVTANNTTAGVASDFPQTVTVSYNPL